MKATSRDAASPWSLNPFTAQSVVPATEELEAVNAKDAAAKLIEAADAMLAVQRDRAQAHTHYVVRGFEEAHKFVREYDVTSMGPLFILFMADTDANGTYWFPPSQQVKDAVHEGFKRAPRGSRLVEIRVGAQDYWNDLTNPFRQNQLFYIDYLPTLVRYEGGGNSSSLLAGPNCLNQDLLDVVFQVNTPTAGKPIPNRVVHMTTMKQVMDFLASYDYTYPLYMFFVSGVHSFNGRMWCPFCDKAEVPTMHYYNYTAPADAVMLHIVVAREPRQWFDEDNDFVGPEFSEKVVEFDGVPYLGFVGRNKTTQKIKVNEFVAGVDEHAKLQEFFRQKPAGAAIAPVS
ncbi:hypothetical protein BBO99_00002502 [Phytophthora kernoviae]|uniref:Thioredoxin domain-containing protein n=2 Tax=Phytophthora kernoviae TaxID=325452 RepID=A0A3R7JA37_9STRA|nr:hypothetical protein G195_002879 [Phytophthora kernoviae 00238/432]KAG2525115.1 hypothetical protein JM16_004692 [Phytophthora kernoviae]KAG2530596.1 hypothetical protein JM18_002039 [Phytophthora kernoviae]RLN36787.1 hypothetical protein BBI17_002406 [Phytophthora kernoviae]RLN82961.1 hypothetical protein BBO99_00002502 [Phytophthora kernoviae]